MPKEVKIAKMHGNGNDFVLVDEFHKEVVPEKIKPDFAKAVCHRRFGVGADGVLFIQPSVIADAKFRYFNPDGSEVEMCGNGIRCSSRYVVEEGYAEGKLRIESLVGILNVLVSVENGIYWIKVEIREPRFKGKEIPAKECEGEDIWKTIFEIDREKYNVYAINIGVPHAVVFVADFNFDIVKHARRLRYSDMFPQGVNVNFVKIISSNEIQIRTYERGVENETLSCGTGSVAAAVIANKLGLVSNRVNVVTRGGMLKIEVGEKIYLTGSASRVFDGVVRMFELGMSLSIS